jgi:hypothetical protein
MPNKKPDQVIVVTFSLYDTAADVLSKLSTLEESYDLTQLHLQVQPEEPTIVEVFMGSK